VTDLEIHAPSERLVAATLGRGAWIVPLLNASAVNGDPEFATAPNLYLSPPSPNPTAGPVRLRYAAHASGPVSLEVFDVRGRLVERLAERPVGDGEVRELTWNPAKVAPGVYFATLHEGERKVVRKITVMDH
jgi:hypothetical protein